MFTMWMCVCVEWNTASKRVSNVLHLRHGHPITMKKKNVRCLYVSTQFICFHFGQGEFYARNPQLSFFFSVKYSSIGSRKKKGINGNWHEAYPLGRKERERKSNLALLSMERRKFKKIFVSNRRWRFFFCWNSRSINIYELGSFSINVSTHVDSLLQHIAYLSHDTWLNAFYSRCCLQSLFIQSSVISSQFCAALLIDEFICTLYWMVEYWL